MNNLEKYEQTFSDIFEIEKNKLEDLEYQGIESWDSVGHMSMVAAVEDVFDIEMDTDDIIDFSSYKKGYEILGKYGIKL